MTNGKIVGNTKIERLETSYDVQTKHKSSNIQYPKEESINPSAKNDPNLLKVNKCHIPSILAGGNLVYYRTIVKHKKMN